MPLTPKTTRRATTTLIAGRYLASDDDTVVPIMSTVTRLGRSLSADVELDEASVSRRHALIVREDGDTIELGTARLRYVEVAELATDELIAA